MFTSWELLQILITSIAVSYIFTAFVPRQVSLKEISPGVYMKKLYSRFDWDSFKMAAMIGIPAIILHELFHKFASIAVGIPAYYTLGNFFGIPAGGLLIGIVLRAMNAGFIFFAPGYVLITGAATPIQTFLIAFAGPFANLILFAGSALALKYLDIQPKKYEVLLQLSKRINLWLFILNMLPIPPLDGSKVITSLFQIIGGIL